MNDNPKSVNRRTSPPQRRWHILVLIILFLAVALPGLSTLPVIDRDEARFAQASLQMAESGDLINIRFQDEARNKKPAGIYWLQTLAIKAFNKDGEPRIWVQRLPSVLGGLLAVLATYWGGAKLVGREAAFIGAAAFALSLMLIFESHIAKTDAVLVGLSASCFAALAHIRANPSGLSLWRARPAVWVFWIALGLSVLIKGPVVPSLVALTCLTLLIWERRGNGLRQLLNIPAMLVSLCLFLPWAIAIGIETQGAFFAESLGNDFGGKLVSAQESHPGPPGYHLLHIHLTLWPGSLLLLPGLAFAFRTLKNNKTTPNPLAKSIRFCLAWIIPFWLLIEIMPTKLPHYALPLFPALCLLIGLAGTALMRVKDFPKLRFVSGLLFILLSTLLIAVLVAGQTLYGPSDNLIVTYIVTLLAGISAIIAGFSLWSNRLKIALVTAAASALALNILAYGAILPSLTQLRLADKLEAAFVEDDILLPRQNGPKVQALNFTEPSLVYRFGKDIRLGSQTDLSQRTAWKVGQFFIIDSLRNNSEDFANFQTKANEKQACLSEREQIKGLNYSRGDDVTLHIFEVIKCNPPSAQ